MSKIAAKYDVIVMLKLEGKKWQLNIEKFESYENGTLYVNEKITIKVRNVKIKIIVSNQEIKHFELISGESRCDSGQHITKIKYMGSNGFGVIDENGIVFINLKITDLIRIIDELANKNANMVQKIIGDLIIILDVSECIEIESKKRKLDFSDNAVAKWINDWTNVEVCHARD